ncbi:ComEC/Rec2 family competence protein [Croceimicrobium sp.]|uniref:ComEC/Rec2 family competence protein n=1 Tax=Croceimicrobium sp. TaxID=2828340 RepID=UPI003BAA8423
MDAWISILKQSWKGNLALISLCLILILKLLLAQPKMLEEKQSIETALSLNYIEKKGIRYELHFAEGRAKYYCRSTDSICAHWNAGDRFWIKGDLLPVSGPSRPDQFNFKRYLQNQNIRARLEWSRIAKIKSEANFKEHLLNYRNSLAQRIDTWPWTDNQKALYKALFLGLKGDINPELRKNFGTAGLMHLLAVSGLHLGIVYLLLQYVLIPFKSLPYSRILICFLSIIGLWSFSLLSGAGPSVLRAATLFSFLAIAKLINRPGGGLRAVWASALVLLWFQPLLIRQLGFLLSYSAVIGILYLVPKLKAWHSFKSRPLRAAQELIYVSLAAQLFTAPLSLYVFGSFPLYFLLANLLVLPLMTLIMYTGLLVLLLDQFKLLNTLNEYYPYLLEYLGGIGNWISSLPNAQIPVNVSLLGCILAYVFLASWLFGPQLNRKKYILLGLILCSLNLGYRLYQKKTEHLSLIVYPGNKNEFSYRSGLDHYHLKGSQLKALIDTSASLPYIDPNISIKIVLDRLILNSPLESEPIEIVNDYSAIKVLNPAHVIFTGKSLEKEKAWRSYCQALNISFLSSRTNYLELH